MNFIDLAVILSSEGNTEEYLQHLGILKTFDHCIHCESAQVLKVRRGNFKCYSCKKEWSPKKSSVLEDIRVSPQQFLLIIKCFALGLPEAISSQECSIDALVVRKIYMLIRQGIKPSFASINSDIKELSLLVIYNQEADKFNTFLSESTTKDGLVASIYLKRTKRSDGSYTYRIENLKLKTGLSKDISERLDQLKSKIEDRLLRIRSRSTRECILNIGETVFRFNNNSSEIFEKIIDIIA